MRRSEFGDLLDYLKNRPECAAELMSILEMAKGKGQGSQENTERGAGDQEAAQKDWKTVKQVADMLGMSRSWLSARLCKLSADAVHVKQRGTYQYQYMIDVNIALKEIQNLKLR